MYSCVKPSRAPVRPVVIRPGGTEALPVDLVIDEIVAAAASGRAVISGGPGSGKTVAIAHIAELVPLSIACLDGPQPRDRTPTLVISTCTEVERLSAAAPFILAPWGEDQVVEYLMSLHRGCCRDVM